MLTCFYLMLLVLTFAAPALSVVLVGFLVRSKYAYVVAGVTVAAVLAATWLWALEPLAIKTRHIDGIAVPVVMVAWLLYGAIAAAFMFIAEQQKRRR